MIELRRIKLFGKINNMINALLKKLWDVWGTLGWESEWDGRKLGGGKLSQRFWEYFWIIKQADFGPNSVVLDVGSGSTLFFPKLISKFVAEVVAYDPESPVVKDASITVIQEIFNGKNIRMRPYTHICCISVMEHVQDIVKPDIIRAMDSFPVPVFMTFELGANRYKEQFLTMPVLSKMVSYFKKHYCAEMETCPVWSEDSSPLHIQSDGGGSITNLSPLWRPFGCVFQPIIP